MKIIVWKTSHGNKKIRWIFFYLTITFHLNEYFVPIPCQVLDTMSDAGPIFNMFASIIVEPPTGFPHSNPFPVSAASMILLKNQILPFLLSKLWHLMQGENLRFYIILQNPSFFRILFPCLLLLFILYL